MGIKHKKMGFIKINKQIHPLTLDQKWHILFGKYKTLKMKELEKKLNALLKAQGQLNNDHKEYGQLKKKVLSDIIGDMPAFEGAQENGIVNMEKNKRYINGINQKLEKIENKLIKLPKEIETINSELLEVSMALCYERIARYKTASNEMEAKINAMREELKDLMIKKNEGKEEYDLLYAYMHDLVGPEIIEQFDALYLGGKAK